MRAEIPAPALATLKRHGKSFAWAGRILARHKLDRAAKLYAFCRTVDDMADRAQDPRAAREALETCRQALQAGDKTDPLAAMFLQVEASAPVDRRSALHLVDTVAKDLGGVAIESERDLIRYSYGVAGTVGLMMCDVLEVRDPAARAFAIDLGIAMQLTNIARDVAEDHAAGRIYVPALADKPRLIERRTRHAYDAVLGLLALAERYYRSGDAGMRYLPGRARAAILTAARVYEAIGRKIRAAGPEAYWAGRAMIHPAGKVLHTGRALAAYPRLSSGPSLRHDPALHRHLDGLPHANR